ncbi:MAG: tetratricopeptide repeat protein [Acidobacteria bacterium]|nr:tetratricopeptide repeat protein [Acidobacteriota bacterium]
MMIRPLRVAAVSAYNVLRSVSSSFTALFLGSTRHRAIKLALVLLSACLGLTLVAGQVSARRETERRGQIPPIPTEPFSPSNARTEDGKLIPVEHFFPASRCASCHQDTHKSWSESLHRNAAREPFYRESADILLRTRGIEFTRHCESCHTPVALFSGALTKESGKKEAPFTSFDHEGVTCSVCHSITEARLDGTGSFTIRRPALLAREDGTPIYGDFSDEQILADVPGHKRAVMRPLLKSPEFCATCHKVDAPPSLNGYKNIRGFSAYDEWQQSGASHESVLPFYQRDKRTDCRACHMPKVASANDRAAKQGKIASHRWLGANTAAPLFYGQKDQVELTRSFLQTNVVDVDIFALKRDATGELIAPLNASGDDCFTPLPGEAVTIEVVVSNRNAAHSFPPEVHDLYEAWVEFEAVDASGKTVYHSGSIKPNGMLDESAHVYKQIILDEQARPITRHQIWLTNIKAYDNTILPGRSDVARFRFRVPEGEGLTVRQGSTVKLGNLPVNSAITLRARVNYRRVNQEYANYVLTRQKRQLVQPIVRMAEAETKLMVGMHKPAIGNRQSATGNRQSQWKRWNNYGIGLLEQAQYRPAAEAFRRASALNPGDPNLLVNIAIAEMRTERFGPEREQWRKAAQLLDRALRIPQSASGEPGPTPQSLWRARYFRSLVLRGDERLREAADELKQIAIQYPRDREVLRSLGQTLYAMGEVAEARAAFEALVAIDPTDFGAWQFLASVYSREGRKADAERAQSLYLKWRDDPLAYEIALRFFASHPQWADERNAAHVHSNHSSLRAVVTGLQAAPAH